MDANSGETVACTSDDDCTCGSDACVLARRQRSNARMAELVEADDRWYRNHVAKGCDDADDGEEEVDLQRRCDKLI